MIFVVFIAKELICKEYVSAAAKNPPPCALFEKDAKTSRVEYLQLNRKLNHCWTVMRMSRPVFVGHMVGFGTMKRNKKINRMKLSHN